MSDLFQYWNEKTKYKKFTRELGLLSEDKKYTLHHEFLKTLTEKSEEYVTLVCENIHQCKNLFNILISCTMTLFLRYMNITNLCILTCRNFGLFFLKATPELYLLFMIYL